MLLSTYILVSDHFRSIFRIGRFFLRIVDVIKFKSGTQKIIFISKKEHVVVPRYLNFCFFVLKKVQLAKRESATFVTFTVDNGVFPKWNRNLLNSASSGNLINH